MVAEGVSSEAASEKVSSRWEGPLGAYDPSFWKQPPWASVGFARLVFLLFGALLVRFPRFLSRPLTPAVAQVSLSSVLCSHLSSLLVLSMHMASATVYMYMFCNPCINYLLLCNTSHQNVVPSNNNYFLAYSFWGSGIRERRSWDLFPEVKSAHHMPRGRTHTAGGWRPEFLVCGPLLRLPEYSCDMVVSFSQSEGARPSRGVLYDRSLASMHRPFFRVAGVTQTSLAVTWVGRMHGPIA